MTDGTNPVIERDCVADLAEHLCARRPCGETPENVADWLDYSLNRCGLMVVGEAKYAELFTRAAPPANPVIVERVTDAVEAVLLQRIFAKRLDGYVIEAAKEIAQAALEAMPDVEALKAKNDRLNERLVETQMLAFKWMEAHDKLHAGEPYDFPRPADLPTALADVVGLREALEPFVNIRDQCPQAGKIIVKAMDGLTPVTVTVTKAQFLKAVAALAKVSGE